MNNKVLGIIFVCVSVRNDRRGNSILGMWTKYMRMSLQIREPVGKSEQ